MRKSAANDTTIKKAGVLQGGPAHDSEERCRRTLAQLRPPRRTIRGIGLTYSPDTNKAAVHSSLEGGKGGTA
jgi:hypothetical protein